MTEKELKRMSRAGLVEIIAAQKKRELELEAQVKRLEKQLEDRTLKIAAAGSIAEAALAVSGIFETAQNAADTYLRSVHAAAAGLDSRLEQTEKECEEKLAEADRLAKARIWEAEKQCAVMIADANRKIQERWDAANGQDR